MVKTHIRRQKHRKSKPRPRRAKKWAHVSIKIRNDAEMRRLLALEQELEGQGVDFDTGYDFGSNERDWELDWSLRGNKTPSELVQQLRREGFKFRVKWMKPSEEE